MPSKLKTCPPEENSSEPTRRRPPWRQRLVEAERGITYGFRGDSVFFVHFFLGSLIVATAFVLEISMNEWATIIVALTMVLSAEMFNQVLNAIVENVGHQLHKPMEKARRIGTAAVYLVMLGAAVTMALIFGPRLLEMFGNV